MRTTSEIALELKLLFARLFESDSQIEELIQHIAEKREMGQSRVEEHVGIGNIIDKQKYMVEKIKILSREYWKAL